MADFEAYARSNYFHVKDEQAFRAWTTELGFEIWSDDNDPTLFAFGSDDGWPDKVNDETAECGLRDFDIAQELAKHLSDKSVAILVEVAHEELNYLAAGAIAINAKGGTRAIDLSRAIMESAKELLLDSNDTLSLPEY